MFVPEALENVVVESVVWPVTVRYPPTLIFVEETFVEDTFVTAIRPASTVPVADTENCVDELTWKLMKSPLNPVAGFEPMKVPEAFAS